MSQEFFFRLLVSPLFLVSGLGHLLRRDHFVDRLLEGRLGAAVAEWIAAEMLVVGTGLVLFAGGICLAFDIKAKWSSRILAALLIPITVVGQTKGVEDVGPFLKNMAIIASLLYFASTMGKSIHQQTKSDS